MIPEDYLNELTARLATQAEDVCRHLLTGGKRKGRRWICGGVDGGAGQSMNLELEGDKAGVWHDAATGEAGTLLTLWQVNRGIKFPEAIAEAANFLGILPPDTREPAPKLEMNPKSFTFEEPPPPDPLPAATDDAPPPYRPTAAVPAVDWEGCVKNFLPAHAEKLCEWRGFSPEFVASLHKEKLIGVHNGCYAFPVHNPKGEVVRIHYRREKDWGYHPKGGGESAALVIGNPIHAIHTLAFESQWDAFAVLDKLGAHHPENEGIYAAIITRGANSNTNLSKLAIPHLIAFPQNDPPEKVSKTTGRTPAEEWLHKIQTTRHPVTEFLVAEIPSEHKDANDWIREENPDQHAVFQRMIDGAENPALRGVYETKDLMAVDTKDDPDSLIGFERRFLGKGGSWLWVGPSGIGKSTLLASFLIHAAAGVPWFGITFRRPLRIVVVQAENDRGDLAEMVRGAINASTLNPAECELAMKNIRWVHETERTGQPFCERVESLILSTASDVVAIDPLLSFVGDDISQQKVASTFLRNGLQPVLKRTGAIAIIAHHTGKTPKDSGAYKGWNDSDFSYLGIGSSDVTNWSRAISTFTPYGSNSGVFRFMVAKRGNRAGLRDMSTGEVTNSIFLKHSGRGQGWAQCEVPEIIEQPRKNGRQQKLTDEGVLLPFKNAATALRKDRLIAEIATVHDVSARTVRERVDRLLLARKLRLASTTKREGGGHDYEWLQLHSEPSGKNQMETSD